MNGRVKMHRSFVLAGVLMLAAGAALAQDDSSSYAKFETSPAFMYIHTSPVFGSTQGFNCAGGGGTLAYNFNSYLGFAADLGGCKGFGFDNTYGIGSKVNAGQFTYLFGPRLTFRQFGKFQPFFELSFGGDRVSVSCRNGNAGNACGGLTSSQLPSDRSASDDAVVVVVPINPNATSASKNAFALSVGGGFDIKLSKKVALRVVQAEYLYTRFGNDCPFAVCSNNNNQNSFRLKSGIVVGWGGAK
jgi:opacity protein-like surface antigen